MAKKQTQDRRFVVRREVRPVDGKNVFTGKWGVYERQAFFMSRRSVHDTEVEAQAVADLREARGW